MTTALDFPPAKPGLNTEKTYRVLTITNRADLDRHADAWRSLGTTRGGPIEQFEWSTSCVDAFRNLGNLHIVMVYRDDELVAVAPLAMTSNHGLRRGVMLGVDQCHEPMDLLAADPSALTRLAEALAGQSLPQVFGRLPADSPSLTVLRRAMAAQWFVLTRPQRACPFIPLDASWKEPERHLSSRRRSDWRRARRTAEKLGAVNAEVLTPHAEIVDELLDEAFRIESRSWKGETGSAMRCEPTEAAFCRGYARAASRAGILRICFLRIGDRRVAMQIAMVTRDGFWLLKIGYDAEYRRCSPGNLLLRESIAYAAECGLNTYEFLGLSESWIRVWTRHERPCVSLRAYPRTLHGGLALASDAAAKFGSKLSRRAQGAAVKIRGASKACLTPLMKSVARNYIAGDTLDHAMRVKRQFDQREIAATIGFWNRDQDLVRDVADQYREGLDILANESAADYLSVKLPALRFSSTMFRELIERAQAAERRIHLDSLAPEDADRTRRMVDDALADVPGVDIGYTLPGRWLRSLDDAQWACEHGLFVRVVKGEWPDPSVPQRDARDGFLEVIKALAGGARRVAVATHDPALAAEAIRCLQSRNTPCEVELLYGLPMRDAIRRAHELNVPVRVYIPYGEAYMPYALSQARRKPRILWWLLRDLGLSLLERRPTARQSAAS